MQQQHSGGSNSGKESHTRTTRETLHCRVPACTIGTSDTNVIPWDSGLPHPDVVSKRACPTIARGLEAWVGHPTHAIAIAWVKLAKLHSTGNTRCNLRFGRAGRMTAGHSHT